MRFEVLGPVRAYVDGREVVVRAGRDRTLLAMLLLNADRTVPVDQLVDALWSDTPPRSARNQVQACVSQLRKRLSYAGLAEDLIGTDPAGYRLRVGPEQVDVRRFRALVSEARAKAAAGRRMEARDQYRAALGLWRGPALAGIESTDVRRAAGALEEEHIQAIEERVELDLALGGAGELVGELSDLVQRYSYREGFHAALMQALYRAGRMADALAAFRRARHLLRAELGAEPGEELQRLHQAILNRDRELTLDTELRSAAVAPVPRELPAEVSCFVGRDKEVAEIREVLAERTSRRRPAVVVLYGPGGVGKSALAVRVAHELADESPDGQLYVDLCGSTPGRRPLGAVDVLGRFLRSLGVHPGVIPSEEAEAAALFRSVTTDRRLLLVLDNAAAKNQIAPLLPASRRCSVLITSRYPQPSLDVDLRLRVEVMSDVDGLTLLTGLTDGLDAAPKTAHDILALTGGLPLAIRIAGGRLACRPYLSPTEYADRLADRSHRLDELQLDDLAVRASVRTSYDALLSSGDSTECTAARVFRILGLIQVPDVTVHVVAASIVDSDASDVRTALDQLVDLQLLEPVKEFRYRMHDLVRLVAAERAAEEDHPISRDEIVKRAIAFYTGGLWRAERTIRPAAGLILGDPPLPGDMLLPMFDDSAQALDWIDAEVPSLIGILAQAASASGSALQLTPWLIRPLWRTLDSTCEWRTARMLSKRLLDSGGLHASHELKACANFVLGCSCACLGDYGEAKYSLNEALMAMRHLDNQQGVCVVMNALGIVEERRGAPVAALKFYEEALELSRRHDLAGVAASVLNNMSVSYTLLARLDEAAAVAEDSLAICAGNENVTTRATALANLATVYCLQGNYRPALHRAGEALVLADGAGDRLRRCEDLIIRSELYRRAGRLCDALTDVTAALSESQDCGYRFAAAAAQGQRARVLAALGWIPEAHEAKALADVAYARLAGVFRDTMIELLLRRP